MAVINKDGKFYAVIYCKVAWYSTYQTIEEAEYKNFKHLQNPKAVGWESFNFKSHRGRVYGSILMPKLDNNQEVIGADVSSVDGINLKSINISRLESPEHHIRDGRIDGVTVIFFGKRSKHEKQVIIGWYKNATVYARPQTNKAWEQKIKDLQFHATTKDLNAHLLPEDDRTFKIKGDLRQAVIWYGTDDFALATLEYIQNVKCNRQVYEKF
ncbi:hypothetical protein C4J81_12955 [Deltaproteobacteria bacterium Smac51]|nr:hypothetical protein C4J81_12955 [Deltaproteobacteria bacterium Smac51]